MYAGASSTTPTAFTYQGTTASGSTEVQINTNSFGSSGWGGWLRLNSSTGYLDFDRARVRWFLSINYDILPEEIKLKGQRTYRSITIEGEELEFSEGFADLHNKVYKGVIDGNGYGLEDAKQSIEMVHDIRNAEPIGLKGDYHPFAKKRLVSHPFNRGN